MKAKTNKKTKKGKRAKIILPVLAGAALLAYGAFALGKRSSESIIPTLKVDSNISGVSITGDPGCGSGQLQKTAPYKCQLPADLTETTLTAPHEFDSSGKQYVFGGWEGCSNTVADWRICELEFNAGESKTVKATYALPTLISTPAKTTSANCRVSSEDIIVGPQPFDPAKPAQLVVYNSTADDTKPVKIQIWDGDTCLNVRLDSELVAPETPGYDWDWGLITSPHPKVGHAYISVLGRSGQPHLIVRDDGAVMADEASIKESLKIPDDVSYTYLAWLNNKTMLIHSPIEPTTEMYVDDKNPDDYFWYNVETGTYHTALGPESLPFLQ